MKIRPAIFQIALLLLFYAITAYIIFPEIRVHELDSGIGGGSNSNHALRDVNILFVILLAPIFIRYLFNLLVSPFYPVHKYFQSKRKIIDEKYRPLVSVIIPAWNEDVGIIQTIKSVLASHYRKIEIVVVNDGSTDNTDEVVKEFISKYGGTRTIKYFAKKNGGKSTALNLGIKKSAGSIIITIDADSVVSREAIANFVKQYRDPSVMCVAGNVKIGNRRTMIGLMQSIEYLGGFYFKKADSLLGSVYIVGGAAASYRRQVFKQLGYFDVNTSTEDIEMSTRIQRARFKIAYASDAVVFTEGPRDVNSLIKQRLRWKYGRFETFYKYRRLFFNPKGNKYLTFFVMPLAVFAEFILLFEGLLLTALYWHLFATGNFASLIVSIMISACVLCIQVVTDSRNMLGLRLLIWAPVVWLIYYFFDFIEFNALIRSIYKLIRKQGISWQKWERVGVYN